MIMSQFDELVSAQKTPAVELRYNDKTVARLGLSKALLMKFATIRSRLECRVATSQEKTQYEKLKSKGISALRKGRLKVVDALIE